ncbi:MAG: hypothetical protein ACW98A_06945 [Candidatus Hodarchaeales archaeon]
MNITSVIILSFLYSYGLILLYITYLAKRNGDKGAFINNAANSIVFIFSITSNLVLIHILKPFNTQFVSFPFDFLFFSFILLYFPLYSLFVLNEKKKVSKEKDSLEELCPRTKDLPLKYDIYRKLTHFVALGIIFFYFTLGFLIEFTQNLVIFLVGASLIGLLTADFTRILIPKYYPLKVVNQILKKKELHMRLGPHISMSIGCFSIILLFGLIQPIGPIIICSSMVMAIFGDTASNLIGRLIGKKQIRNTNKTYEGLFAGIIVAFITGLIVMLLLQNFYLPENLGLFFLPFIGAVIIGLIDYFDLEIDDNLSYIFIISTVLFFCTLLLF